tara:strand:- start:257 stop:472 length:216 start_codon:yes stop_codon:yes gene_type:complete
VKIGDLVTLSSYGVKRDYNSRLKAEQVGIVIKVNPTATYQYTVKWPSVWASLYGATPNHSRRELKYARLKK